MPDSPPTDVWSVWFPRVVQTTGLGGFIYEMVIEQRDRPWILLVAMAMMLGGVGLRLVLGYVVGKAAG